MKSRKNLLRAAGVLLIVTMMVSSFVVLISANEITLHTTSDIPTLMVGNLTGIINGVYIDAIVQASVNLDTGHVTSNIAPISNEIGYSMNPLVSVITVICFSWATEHGGAQNGFHITGCNFNRVVTVTFESGEVVYMNHSVWYPGGDTVYVNATIFGTVPEISSGSNIRLADYNENWVQTNNNTLTGEQQRIYYINNEIFEYHWDLIIHYNTGIQMPFPETRVATGVIAHYNSSTETLHFELTNNIYPSHDGPDIPTIEGPTSGKRGTRYQYTIKTTDPNSENIYYYIIWGDGSYSDWMGPYSSGATVTVNHVWTGLGKFVIKVKAKNNDSLQSDWTTLKVTMPKSFNIPFIPFLEKLFEQFPNAFPILRYLLGY